MTENKNKNRNEAAERVRREMIQSHRNRYLRMYRRRWGIEPPTLSVTRIAWIRGVPAGDENHRTLDILASRGASVDEWETSAPGYPLPPERKYGALVVTAGNLPGGDGLDRFRNLVNHAVQGSTLIAAAGEGVVLLAREGFLRGRRAAFQPGEEESMNRWGVLSAGTDITQDGSFLTCAGGDRVEALVSKLLDLLKQPPPEGAEEG